MKYTAPVGNELGLVNASTGTVPAYFSVATLVKNIVKDEHQNIIIEFKDRLGKTILKKVQVNATEWAETYYVYDIQGRVVTVLPPEAVNRIRSASEYFGTTDVSKNDFLNRWAFRYRYDDQGRMTIKKIPGTEPVLTVYDSRDRVVLSQDGVQRGDKKWTFIKYDALDRPIVKGIYTHGTLIDQATMQTHVNSLIVSGNQFYEDFDGTYATEGYTNRVFPTSSTQLLSITYYDNYNFKSLWMTGYDYETDGLSANAHGISYNQPTLTQVNQNVKGQITGVKLKVLDNGYTWLRTVSYYDEKYRLIQTKSDNHKGGIDRISNLFDFSGRLLKTKVTHSLLTWKDLIGVNLDGNKITKTVAGAAWSVSGLASVEQLPAAQDGWFEFTVTENNSRRMLGISDQNTNANYTTQDYSWYPYNNGTSSTDGSLYIYEGSSNRGIISTYKSGDILRIQRTGTTIRYYQNGQLKYTSTIPSTGVLMADIAFYDAGSTIAGVRCNGIPPALSVTESF